MANGNGSLAEKLRRSKRTSPVYKKDADAARDA
jgi:hypothetical protein